VARVRFIGAEPHIVPELGDRPVQPDEIVSVPDDRWEGYVCQPSLWESIEEPLPPPAAPAVPAPKKTAAAKTPTGSED
jgi:hypothetical protein